MYLDRINRKWAAFLEYNGIKESIVITNTAKLKLSAGCYMLEFLYREKRYHLYHVLGRPNYELRVLDETYQVSSFEHVLGISEQQSKLFMELLNSFMLQHYEGIQTSVDCSEGLEKAQERIHQARLR